MKRTPKIGQNILYVLGNGHARPAVVTNYFGMDRVNCTAFPDTMNDVVEVDGIRTRYEPTLTVGSARYSEHGEPGTWRFLDEDG